MLNKIRLGDDVEARCGRCKEERQHQVVALTTGGRIERVTCKFCHNTHLYRDPAAKVSVKPRATGNGGSSSSARRATVQSETFPSRPARDYSPRESFATGDRIAHPKFGQGEVLEVRAGKIDVRFGKDLRTLLHAG